MAGPRVVSMKPLLVRLVDQVERPPWRTVLDSVTRYVKQDILLGPADLPHRDGRYQNMLAEPPVAGVDDEVADVPSGTEKMRLHPVNPVRPVVGPCLKRGARLRQVRKLPSVGKPCDPDAGFPRRSRCGGHFFRTLRVAERRRRRSGRHEGRPGPRWLSRAGRWWCG